MTIVLDFLIQYLIFAQELQNFNDSFFFTILCDILPHFGELLHTLRKTDAWYLNERLKINHEDIKTNKQLQQRLIDQFSSVALTVDNFYHLEEFLDLNLFKNGKLFFIRHFGMIALVEVLLNLCEKQLYFKLIIIAMLYVY